MALKNLAMAIKIVNFDSWWVCQDEKIFVQPNYYLDQ